MSYYRKTTMLAILGVVVIAVGFAGLSTGAVSGLILFSGVVFLAAAGFYRSKPMLEIDEDHLAYDPAMLRPTRLIAREDVESIDVFGDDVQINTVDGDTLKLPTKQLKHADPLQLEGELNAWFVRGS